MNKPVANAGKKTRTFSTFWLMPLIAFVISSWMIYREYVARGPLIEISFETAEGIFAGKTKIKALSVDIGVVESVTLLPTLKGVSVEARLNKEISPFLNENSKFWVVRPRIGSSGISGLGTILSGAYIELAPGKGTMPKREFVGLEDVPNVDSDTPGLHLTLIGDTSKSLNRGDPVLYRGYKVGSIQNVDLDIDKGRMIYKVFISAPYHQLVSTNTRFWDASGIEVSTSTEGLKVRTASIESILSGGIAFDLPRGIEPGESVKSLHEFNLYRDIESTLNVNYTHYVEYVILVEDSIRGLKLNAPVEYRGVPVGTVSNTYMKYSDVEKISPKEDRIPILIRIEPARLGFPDNEYSVAALQFNMNEWIQNGLRASLKSGNLITGSLYVDLDSINDKAGEQTQLQFFDKYPIIPYIAGGLSQVQDSISKLLDKLNGLPIEQTLEETAKALTESRTAITRSKQLITTIDNYIEKADIQRLPAEINALLGEMKSTLEDYSENAPLYRDLNKVLRKLMLTMAEAQPLIRDIKHKPNSLIFDNGDNLGDEIPTKKPTN